MAKILLVEDDSNLREIYGARLEAEGYKIVSASDGEEALATAVRERPDLIISDVMMPKISGFDMLDILRTTPETKDVKVIVMTALSQEEDRQRGESLGADRYVVKSQVTLDDVVTMVQELLTSPAAAPAPAVDQPQPPTDQGAPSQPDPTATQATTGVTTPQPDPTGNIGSAQAQSTPAPSLNDEVHQFVQTSPLMNGTAPTPQQPVASQPPQDDDATAQTDEDPQQPVA